MHHSPHKSTVGKRIQSVKLKIRQVFWYVYKYLKIFRTKLQNHSMLMVKLNIDTSVQSINWGWWLKSCVLLKIKQFGNQIIFVIHSRLLSSSYIYIVCCKHILLIKFMLTNSWNSTQFYINISMISLKLKLLLFRSISCWYNWLIIRMQKQAVKM